MDDSTKIIALCDNQTFSNGLKFFTILYTCINNHPFKLDVSTRITTFCVNQIFFKGWNFLTNLYTLKNYINTSKQITCHNHRKLCLASLVTAKKLMWTFFVFSFFLFPLFVQNHLGLMLFPLCVAGTMLSDVINCKANLFKLRWC